MDEKQPDHSTGLEPGSNKTGGAGKKTYRSPRLTSYGDLRSITVGTGGKKNDATPPGGKSKA